MSQKTATPIADAVRKATRFEHDYWRQHLPEGLLQTAVYRNEADLSFARRDANYMAMAVRTGHRPTKVSA